MNSVLFNSDESIIDEIKEMVKKIDEIKSEIDIFGEMVKNQIKIDSV